VKVRIEIEIDKLYGMCDDNLVFHADAIDPRVKEAIFDFRRNLRSSMPDCDIEFPITLKVTG